MAAFPRYAIYYVAAPGSDLDRFGAQLLGYDAFSGEHSGWHTEDLVSRYRISRQDQDRWAARSQQRFSAAQAAGIPWSMTLHRWDIYENNLLAAKVHEASFTRVISESAAADVRTIVPDAQPRVVHMGVDVPAMRAAARADGGPLRLVCVASLAPTVTGVTTALPSIIR